MKSSIALGLAAAFSAVATYFFVSDRLELQHAAELVRLQKSWEIERTGWQTASRTRRPSPSRPVVAEPKTAPMPQVVAGVKTAPAEVLQKLTQLRVGAGPRPTRNVRQAIALFEQLTEAGPEALPVIAGFLARNEEIEYAVDKDDFRKGLKEGKITTDFVLPPSLRLGLFEVVKQIGGDQAEAILAQTLSTTGRGVEVGYLARALDELAPGKYRDAALNAAHDLLANPLANPQPSRLDKGDRDYLFAVLAMHNDPSFATTAQGQLVNAEGRIDHGALRYLKQTLGEQALPMVMQALQDSRMANPDKQEALLDLVANHVGWNAQANTVLHSIVQDRTLPMELREASLGVLYKSGLNHDQPGPGDLQLAQARLQVLAELKPDLTDPNLMQHAVKIERGLLALFESPERRQKAPKKP